ncbi:hypothetical protein F5B22DRAFT_638814 [Xylaria bambusicola]|uniref:uncharacterized protein n=1 Tax=Xylaria bambusicola TaxID=326684 RepID=UPI00200791F5|nr:uncharacterized protein F5B22DRAFT_638814 [Xylaria bambusicola]KAI0508270.1 hypothetical protein F5B22DRAFT_638814 [Xylaria bambusicola]
MPADTDSSDDSDGGAPLYPSMTTPIAPPLRRHEEAKLESPSDEEKALVRASENFGSLKDPFAETPGVPQSIHPNAYSHHVAFPQPTPSRANNGFSRFGNAQSAGRYRSSTAAPGGQGSSVPRFRPGMGGTPFNNGNLLADEPGVYSCQQVFASIMTATQYVNISPGLSSQTQTQLTHLLQEISQGFSTITVQLRKQRDEANRGKEDEHERYKRAMHEAEELRKSLEEVEAINRTLMPQLNHSSERENLMKDHIKDLQKQLVAVQKQLDTLTSDAVRFHAHHDKVIENYKEQDEKHFKAMTDLESEVKALRSNSHISLGGAFSTPTQPASVNNVQSTYDSNSPKPRNKLSAYETSLLLNDLHKLVGPPKKDSFVPNPQAPAWAPATASIETLINNAAKSSSNSSTERQDDSSSGNSGEVILYNGHGNQSKSLTPYVGPPAHGGAPTFIRTPFGVVFGEYPTVEENSRLPGDKFIPREKEEWEVVDVQRAMAHLYDLCKGYVANCHMNSPPNVPFNKLKEQESYTWHYLMQQVYKDPEHASSHLTYLLSTRVFVPYLLQRTCVDYLLKKLLTPQVFLGFSDQMDAHLRALQGQLANIADNRDRPTYNRNRQRVIEDHAKLIKAIAMSKEVSEFRRRTVERHANIMSALLDPCRAQGISVEVAQKSLRIMAAACWDISIKVWSSGKTLHYVFPECANKFSPGTMEALNGHHMAASSEELVASQCRVSLVVTPTMTLRDDRDAARMQCFAIHKAQVLVMK